MISPWKLTTFTLDNDLFGDLPDSLFVFGMPLGASSGQKENEGEASESDYSDR